MFIKLSLLFTLLSCSFLETWNNIFPINDANDDAIGNDHNYIFDRENVPSCVHSPSNLCMFVCVYVALVLAAAC